MEIPPFLLSPGHLIQIVTELLTEHLGGLSHQVGGCNDLGRNFTYIADTLMAVSGKLTGIARVAYELAAWMDQPGPPAAASTTSPTAGQAEPEAAAAASGGSSPATETADLERSVA